MCKQREINIFSYVHRMNSKDQKIDLLYIEIICKYIIVKGFFLIKKEDKKIKLIDTDSFLRISAHKRAGLSNYYFQLFIVTNPF